MLEKQWKNNAICRVFINTPNEIINNTTNENIINEDWMSINSIHQLKDYILQNNLNIIIPNNYEYISIQLTNNIKEQKFLNKILNYYTNKYKINPIEILYIIDNISNDFILHILKIISPKYMLITDNILIKLLINKNILELRGEIIHWHKINIMYTLSLSTIINTTTYISLFSNDINKYIKHIVDNKLI